MKGVACENFRRRAQNRQKACDHEKRILWPVFGQNKIFWTRQSWISIPSTCLSCWPIHVPSTRCIKRCEEQKYGYEQGRNQHMQTQLKWRSLCSSRYCSTFAPLFSLFLGCRCFFEKFQLFIFIFWYFSSLRSTKEVTIENMSLNKWKAWPVKISEEVLKIDKNLVTMKRVSCDHFLTKIKISDPKKIEMDGSKKIFWSILIHGTSKSEFICEN